MNRSKHADQADPTAEILFIPCDVRDLAWRAMRLSAQQSTSPSSGKTNYDRLITYFCFELSCFHFVSGAFIRVIYVFVFFNSPMLSS